MVSRALLTFRGTRWAATVELKAENLNFVNCAAQHSWRRLLHKETVMLGAIKATVVEKTARGA